MALHLVELDDITRRYMLEELDSDISNHNLVHSTRLNAHGRSQFPRLLREAFANQDDTWLANKLRAENSFNETEQRVNSRGGPPITAKVASNAAEVLAEGEFNRFYIRAVCRRAIDEGMNEVEAYRAKDVNNPRPETQARIGQKFGSHAVLDDLRANVGIDTVFGLPAGPNSGLSVRLLK